MKACPAYVSVGVPVAMAAVESTKCVPSVTDETVAPLGTPAPDTNVPTTKFEVVVTVTVVLVFEVELPVATTVPAFVERPVRGMPVAGTEAATACTLFSAATAVCPVAVPVAGRLMVKVLGAVTRVTTAP